MTKLCLKDFMKKYNIKNDTMNESEIHSAYNYPMFPKDSGRYSNEIFLNIDDGSMSHCILKRSVVSQIIF